MKRLAELDATNPNVVKEGTKKSSTPVQLEEGLDTSSLKMLSGQQPIVECGIPAMGAPMPSMTPPMPASLNMSAGNASEIVQMVRGLMDLAKTDGPTQAPYPGMGAPMPDLLGGIPSHEPLNAEPSHDAMNAPAIPDVKGMDAPKLGLDADHDGDFDEPGDISPMGGPTDLDVAGDQEIMDLIKKIRTGEPVKVTTDQNVKVKTSDPIKGSTTDKHTSSDTGEEDEGMEGMRDYDNSPKEKVKAYNPNDMADLRDKVSEPDKEYQPSGSGSNPLPKADKKKEESLSFEQQLFAEYKKFVSESKEKGVSESETQHIPIGQQMANDGITYSREKEGEIIDLMVQYMKKDGMSPKSIRYYINYDEDYVPDQLSYLPRAKKSGDDSVNEIGDTAKGKKMLSKVKDRATDRAWNDPKSAHDRKFATKQLKAFKGADSRLDSK